MQLDGDASTQLRSFTPTDAATLLAAVEADRGTLDPWLRWSATIRTEAEARDFIARFGAMEESGRGFHLGIWQDGRLLGGVPCWSIDPVHHVAELGYWLAASARGTGLAARATRRVVDHLFRERQVNRIEFQCLVANGPSRRLAERVGATFEGIRRQSHWFNGAFRDHAVYAILAGDPPPELANRPGSP